MTTHTIKRVYLEDRTLSTWYDEEGHDIAKVLELPWKNNERRVSAIPEGKYEVRKEPPKPGREYWHFRVLDVPGRDGILIHIGNNPTHSQGCLLVGSRFGDYNTAHPTVVESTAKMNWLTRNLPDKFYLNITKK